MVSTPAYRGVTTRPAGGIELDTELIGPLANGKASGDGHPGWLISGRTASSTDASSIAEGTASSCASAIPRDVRRRILAQGGRAVLAGEFGPAP